MKTPKRFSKMKAAVVAALVVASALYARAGENWSGTLSHDPENPTKVFSEIKDLDVLFNSPTIEVSGHLGGSGKVNKDVDAFVKCAVQPEDGLSYQLQVNDYKSATDCHLKLASVTFTAKEDGIYAVVTGMAYVNNGGPTYVGTEVSASTPGYHGGQTGYEVTALSWRNPPPAVQESWFGPLGTGDGRKKVFSKIHDLVTLSEGCRLYGCSNDVKAEYKYNGVFVKCAQQPDNGAKYQLQFNDYRGPSDCHLKVIEILFTAEEDGIYAEVVRTGYVNNGGPTHLGKEATSLYGHSYSASGLCWRAQIAPGETETVDGTAERAGVIGFGTLVKTGASDTKLSIVNFDKNWGFAVEDTTIQIDGGEVCISTVKHNGDANYDDARVKNATFVIGADGALTQYGWYNLYGTITFENETDKTVLGQTVRTSDGLKFVKRGAGKLTFNSDWETDNYGIQGLTVEGGQIAFADSSIVSTNKLDLDFSKLSAAAPAPVVGDLTLAKATTFRLPADLPPGQTFALCTGTLSGDLVGTTIKDTEFFCGNSRIIGDLTITASGVSYTLPSTQLYPDDDFLISELNDQGFVEGTDVGVHLKPGAKLVLDDTPNIHFLVYSEDELRLASGGTHEIADSDLEKIDLANVMGRRIVFVDTVYIPPTAPASGWTYRWEGTTALPCVPYCGDSVSGTVELACPIAEVAETAAITVSNDHTPGYVFDDGFSLTAAKLICGENPNPYQKFVQRGGEITLTNEYTSTAETGSAAPLIFAKAWTSNLGAFSYDLVGGSLKAEAGNVMFGYDGGVAMTVGGGETDALFSVYGLQWDGRYNTSTLTLNPRGTLRLGAGGIDFRNGKSLALNGGRVEAAVSATISTTLDVTATADSTVAVGAGVTLTITAPITGEGALTVEGAGEVVVGGASTASFVVEEGAQIAVIPTADQLANGYEFKNIYLPTGANVRFTDGAGHDYAGAGNVLSPLSKTWVGGAFGAWDEPTNWSGGTVPTAADVVKLDTPAEIALTSSSVAGSVFVNANVTFKGHISTGKIVGVTIAEDVALTVDLVSGDESTMRQIMGPGALVKTGEGRLRLQNANGSTIDGATIDIREGTVQLDNGGTQVPKPSGGNTNDSLSIDPTFIIGEKGELNTWGCILMRGTLTVDNETDKVILENVGGADQISGNISIVKRGAGALTLMPGIPEGSSVSNVTLEGQINFTQALSTPALTLTGNAKIGGNGLVIIKKYAAQEKAAGKGLEVKGSIDLNGHTLTVDVTGAFSLTKTKETDAAGGTIVFENGKLVNGGGETHIEHINLVLKDTPINLTNGRICANIITLTGVVDVTGNDRLVFNNPIKVAGGSITFHGYTYLGLVGNDSGIPTFELDPNVRVAEYIAKADSGTGALSPLKKVTTVTCGGKPAKFSVITDDTGAVILKAQRNNGFMIYVR